MNVENNLKEETIRKVPSHISVGEVPLIKGVVHGGLEKYFYPLKTRSARNLGKEKESTVIANSLMIDGPRAFRAHKSLVRV